MTGSMRLIMRREGGRMIQTAVWQQDRPIEREDSPPERWNITSGPRSDRKRISLPVVRSLPPAGEAPRPIRFAPSIAPVDPVRLRNLETIRRVGKMLARAGE